MWSSIDAAVSSSAVRVGERTGEAFALAGWLCNVGGRVDVIIDLLNAKVLGLGDGSVRVGGIWVVIEGRN